VRVSLTPGREPTGSFLSVTWNSGRSYQGRSQNRDRPKSGTADILQIHSRAIRSPHENSRAMAECLHDQGEGRRRLPSAGIVEMISGQRWAPVVEHPHEPTFLHWDISTRRHPSFAARGRRPNPVRPWSIIPRLCPAAGRLPDGRSTIDLFGNGFTLLRLGAEAPDSASLECAFAERGRPAISTK
jgi:hypothetical protein